MRKGFIKLAGNLGLSLVMALLLTVAGMAQAKSVEGTYSVTATSEALGSITFLMTLKRDGDKWAGEVKDSPTPLLLSSVTVDGSDKVTILGDAAGTPVTINGKFEGGKISGDWSAGDIKGTWSALKSEDNPGAKPAPAAPVSTVVVSKGLEGTYDAKVIADGQGELPFILIIKKEGEKLIASVENPGDLNIIGIEVQDPDSVKLNATYQGNGPIPLPGKRAGDDLGGKWEFGGFTGSWEAKKKK
jgi:hypothetical protein